MQRTSGVLQSLWLFHMWIGKLCIIPDGSLGSLQPPLIDPQNQAEDYGTCARACGIQPANMK